MHTSDVHGHLEAQTVRGGSGSFAYGGVATLAGMVRDLRERAPGRTLLLDSGDAWQGTFISNASKGAAVTTAMSLIGYDAMALGNHDFDWGQDAIAQNAKLAAFPFLAANVTDASGAQPPWVRPYVVKDLGIAKVAILGLAHEGTPGVTKAGSTTGLRFERSVDTVRRLVPQLRKIADVVIVVTHTGAEDTLEAEAAMARAADVDVILGGHNHGLVLRTPRFVGKTVISHVGRHAENIGRLELAIDPATKAVSVVTRADVVQTVSATAARPNDEVAKLVAAEKAVADKYTARVAGRSLVALDYSREGEFPLGNLVADALLGYGRSQGWNSDLALHNNTGFRAPLPQGEITYGQVFEVLPFGDVVASVDLTGEQLRRILEQTVSGRAGNLVIAGGAYAFRSSNPVGGRVVEATVGGAPLDPARVYHVVTIDYLLLGGDGQTTFTQGRNVIYGDPEADVVAAYIGEHSPVNPKTEGRIAHR